MAYKVGERVMFKPLVKDGEIIRVLENGIYKVMFGETVNWICEANLAPYKAPKIKASNTMTYRERREEFSKLQKFIRFILEGR